MMSFLSLRVKLILPIFVLMAVTFCVAQWFSYVKDVAQKEKTLTERVQLLAKGVSYNLQAAVLFDDQLSAQEILSAFAVDDEVIRVKLYNQQGSLFALYEKQGTEAPIPNEHERTLISLQEYVISGNYIYLLIPVELEGERIASLRMTVSASSILKVYQNALSDSAFFFIVLFLCGLALYLLVQKMIVKPVYSLNEEMKAFIDNRQRSKTMITHSKDEIGELVAAFNTMLDRIEQHEQHVSLTLDKLEKEKSFANEVIDTVQHALVVVDQTGAIILSNDQANKVFKCSSAYLRGSNLLSMIKTDAIDTIRSVLNNVAQLDDELIISQDSFDHQQLLQISSRALSKPGQFLFAIEDVTQIEIALSRQRLAAGVFENSQDGLIVLDQEGIITMINPAVSRLLGYFSDDVVDKRIDEVLIWKQFNSLLPTITESLSEHGQWRGEVWEQHKKGHMVPLLAKVNRILQPDSSSNYDMMIIISDLSNVKEMERLDYLAHHDSLTGLANRSKLYHVLHEIITDNQLKPFSLLYLDLDGFKRVNDTFGHAAGDEVLKQVSQRLLSQVRNQDLVARLSGDEFVVVINPSEHLTIEIMSERLIKLIEEDIIYKGQVMNVGASIGVYFVDTTDDNIDNIMKAADRAMYKAKRLGKGQFVLVNKMS